MTKIVNFLCGFDANVSYSLINSARSALAHLFRFSEFASVCSDPLVLSCMKGLAKQRPSNSKYVGFWNPSILLSFLKSLDVSSLESLTHKCATLLKLVSLQRSHTLTLIYVQNVKFYAESVLIVIFEDLKVRKQRPAFTLNFKKYHDQDLCIVHCLKLLLDRRPPTTATKLFVSSRKPYQPVTANTIARWVKLMMSRAGVDIDVFSAHSSRGASSSTAVNCMDIDSVLKLADWSSSNTFNNFYHKPIIDGPAMDLFSKIVTS